MANLPKGALRSVKKALKDQGGGPSKVKGKEGTPLRVKQETGQRPTRLKSYNIRVNDLVEFKDMNGAWLVGQVVGINEIPHHWSGITERTYHILGPDGIGLQNVHGMNVRMIVRPED